MAKIITLPDGSQKEDERRLDAMALIMYFLVAIAIGSVAFGVSSINKLYADSSDTRERLSVMETIVPAMDKRLTRIETKLDQLITLRSERGQ